MSREAPCTVIIAAWNAAATVEQAVVSVLDQSAGRCQIIVVDDGSTDDTPSVLASYESTGQCRVVRISHAGLGPARNAGLDCVDTEYLTFLDADDVLLPGAVANLLRVAVEQRADIVLGPHLRYNRYGVQEPVRYLSWALGRPEDANLREDEPLVTRFPVVTGKLFRTELLRSAGIRFPALSAAEDYVFSVRCWFAATSVHSCAHPVCLRRPFTVRPGKSDLAATVETVRDHLEAARMVGEELVRHGASARVRRTNCRTAATRGLEMAASAPEPPVRSEAVRLVIDFVASLAGDQSFEKIVGVPRDELLAAEPMDLTPARARYWRMRAELLDQSHSSNGR